MNPTPPRTQVQPQNHDIVSNERGSILLAALLVVVTLSFFAVMSLTATHYKLTLSGNDKTITRLKTSSESTAAAAAEYLETLPESIMKDTDWESPTRLPWLSRGKNNGFDMLSGTKKYTAINEYIWDLSNWKHEGVGPYNSEVLTPDTDFASGESFTHRFSSCEFQVIDVEISEGSSLQTGNKYKTMHNLYVTGASTRRSAKRMVQIGYRKVY
jgi:hypothetical protein